MAGGLISLVAVGAQDVYLTGSPQITWFKTIYRRYTNFAMEAINQPIDSCRPGGTYNVLVQRNGDLATKTCLRVSLPAVTSEVLTDNWGKVAWVRRLGHALVRHVKIQIGGMDIDKHYGVWLDLWWELTHTSAQERGYREMIGDVDALTTLSGLPDPTCAEVPKVLLPEYTLYIPFQFWFCRNYGLALPLIALQYHEVRFELHLEEAHRLFCWTGASAPSLGSLSFRDAGILIDYVYLESGERRKYAQLGHEYLIEQVQFTGAENVGATTSTTTNHNVKLTFNHPTKELVWALKLGAFSGEGNNSSFSGGRSRFLSYVGNDDQWSTVAVDNAVMNMAEGCVFVNPTDAPTGEPAPDVGVMRGLPVHRVTEDADNEGHRVVVRQVNRTCPSECECDNQPEPEPAIDIWVYDTFFCNDVEPKFNLLSTSSGVDLFSTVTLAEVLVYHTCGEDIRIECVRVRHSLDLTDVSVPLSEYTTDNRPKDMRRYCAHKDVNVTQPNNYGLRLDGVGNPVSHAKLQLNGHDRFSHQRGAYFNFYQTQNHHTRTPADGVNVYSFALHPEKHQPSGTTNLSRIDNAILQLTLKDSLRENRLQKLDISNDTRLYIFAFSYNVLRVLSGMGGLAYSN